MGQKQPKQQQRQINLQEEMDFWVKDFEKKIQRTNEFDGQINENKQNIDYNYELMTSLKKELEQIKKDIVKLKHYNFIALKSRALKDMDGN